jgi:hypothetical protein
VDLSTQNVGYSAVIARLNLAVAFRRSKPAHREHFEVSDFVSSKLAVAGVPSASGAAFHWSACQQALTSWLPTFPDPAVSPGPLFGNRAAHFVVIIHPCRACAPCQANSFWKCFQNPRWTLTCCSWKTRLPWPRCGATHFVTRVSSQRQSTTLLRFHSPLSARIV